MEDGKIKWIGYGLSAQFSSVAQVYPTLCKPMNRSTPGHMDFRPSHICVQFQFHVLSACILALGQFSREMDSEMEVLIQEICWRVHLGLIIGVPEGKRGARSFYPCEWKKVKALVAQSKHLAGHFATLWTVAHQAPLSMELSRQEYWCELPFPSPGDLPGPEIKPGSPALQEILYHVSRRGSPCICIKSVIRRQLPVGRWMILGQALPFGGLRKLPRERVTVSHQEPVLWQLGDECLVLREIWV